MLTVEKKAIRPLSYPWAHKCWEAQRTSKWWHKSISMQDDKHDWDLRLNEKEKNVIGNILKGFAQTEVEVSNYWSVLVPTWFPVAEIQRMAVEFASVEGLHGEAYNYLNDILGLHDYEGFMKDEAIANRLENLMGIGDNYLNATLEEKAVSVGIFSGGCEGVALFGAFSILLSFRNRKLEDDSSPKLLSGVSQQMEWSVKDENLHSVAGCWIFKYLCLENPGLKERVESRVVDGMRMVVTLEESYLDKIFEMGDIPTISKAEVLAFLHHLCNNKFKELGYNYNLYDDVDMDLVKRMEWFTDVISSNKDNDFFDSHSSAYSDAQGDWDFEW